MKTSLASILEGRRSQPHQLIEVLQDVQKQEGYVSEESMRVVSKELGVPLSKFIRLLPSIRPFL